jgi:hypothetical protein
MPLVTLNTRRCRWLEQGGGCTTCNYNHVATASESAAEDTLQYADALRAQVERATELFPPDLYPFWTLSSAGSFFDDAEVPRAARLELLRHLWALGYRELNFESRAEYCRDEEKLEEVHSIFDGRVSVGIGLESSSDLVRKVCMNKGTTTRVFEQATAALRRIGFSFNCYVLLGKPLLGVWLDDDGTISFDWELHLAETVRTLQYAFDQGAALVILMVANLQPNTLSNALHRRGSYLLPSPWLAVEAIRGLEPELRPRVALKGLMRAMPHPLRHASTCPLCIGAFRRAHMAFNQGVPFEDSLDAVTCDCRDRFFVTLRSSKSRAGDIVLRGDLGSRRLELLIEDQLERNCEKILATLDDLEVTPPGICPKLVVQAGDRG